MFAVSVFSAFLTGLRPAATSDALNFQAWLEASSGVIVSEGAYNVEFKPYDASTSTGSLAAISYKIARV